MCWNTKRGSCFICWSQKAYLILKEKKSPYTMEESGESIIGYLRKKPFYDIHIARDGQMIEIKEKTLKNFNTKLSIPIYQNICGLLGNFNSSLFTTI